MQSNVLIPAKMRTEILILVALPALFLLFAVGYDQGQILGLVFGDMSYQMNIVHEFFHDVRHMAGMACH